MPARILKHLLAMTVVCGILALTRADARTDGRLGLNVVDAQSKEPLAVRLDFRDARNRLVRMHPEGSIATPDGVYFKGETTLELRRGSYSLLLEAGPEYETFFTQPGTLKIDRGAEDSKSVEMNRRVNMAKEGWYAGDLDVRLPTAGVDTIAAARSVSFAPLTTIVQRDGKCERLKASKEAASPTAIRVETRLGDLILIGADDSFDPCAAASDAPAAELLEKARAAGAVVVARRIDSWALPLWVATGKLDAAGLIAGEGRPVRGAKAGTSGPYRPRDATMFPGKMGPGRYSESIYLKLLECGLRIAPAAGTAAGEGTDPLGSNRTYVQTGEEHSPETWLAGLRTGRAVVTNGPLLRPRVEGQAPGYAFTFTTGERREFEIALNLTFYAKTQIEYLEIVKDGRVLHNVRLDEFAKKQGKLPKTWFEESGWFAIRVVTNNTEKYEFATSGAYFVEKDYERRISRSAVEYFRTWLDELANRFASDAGIQRDIAAARPFWDDLLKRANAD